MAFKPQKGIHRIYLIVLFILSIGFVIFHNQVPSELQDNSFVEQVRTIELGSCFLAFFLFWYLLYRKGAKLSKFYRGTKDERGVVTKSGNEFYCLLMLTTALVILFGTVHFLNLKTGRDQAAIDGGVKVWEVSGYIVTTLYTFWFWVSPRAKGRPTVKDMTGDKEKAIISIGLSLLILILFTLLHSYIIFGAIISKTEIYEPFGTYSVAINTVLVFCVYIVFCYIDKVVIRNSTGETLSDFNTMHRFIDRPTLIIFGILSLYAGYTVFLTHQFQLLDRFFSGAIAFELLLSSIVWANTETV
jgi:hypothetical protein